MKILTVIGARPQFIKAAVVSKQIRENGTRIEEIIIHTGQHYDENMSRVFFEEMNIPKPKYNLKLGGLSHGAMTGRMLESIEEVIFKEKPELVMVYGDTNSTLAGALAATKLDIPVIHIEAGLRSYNMKMPEEINRILTDQISSVLFCPTDRAVENLIKEGISERKRTKIIKNGDVMYDAAIYFTQYARLPSFEIPDEFILSTLHRAENTDDIKRLEQIIYAFNKINSEIPMIVPLHPRTKKVIQQHRLPVEFYACDPLGYLEMIYMLQKAKLVMTDSGGLQKESYFFKKPCITIRDQTEWVELVQGGYNQLTHTDQDEIYKAYEVMKKRDLDFSTDSLYGNGTAAQRIVDCLERI